MADKLFPPRRSVNRVVVDFARARADKLLQKNKEVKFECGHLGPLQHAASIALCPVCEIFQQEERDRNG